MTSGLVIVDKPAGWTSHDVVARLRRLTGTRRVGHAGTLDPMATGVLVVGVGKATRLLGHLALTDKVYEATIRLGQSTDTDDAEGEITATAPAGGVTDAALQAAVKGLTGQIMQVPPRVSAIKVDGRRAYKMARKGQEVELKPRPVTVADFTVTAVRRHDDLIDVDAVITCSSGTYIRALARDIGAGLGVGGHLTALRRTAVGRFGLEQARTLEELAAEPRLSYTLDEACLLSFPRRDLTAEEADHVRHGRPLRPAGIAGVYAATAPDGQVIALLEDHRNRTKSVVVLRPATL